LSSIVTVTPPRDVGKLPSQAAVTVDRLLPKIDIQEPGWITGKGLKSGTIPAGAIKGAVNTSFAVRDRGTLMATVVDFEFGFATARSRIGTHSRYSGRRISSPYWVLNTAIRVSGPDMEMRWLASPPSFHAVKTILAAGRTGCAAATKLPVTVWGADIVTVVARLFTFATLPVQFAEI